MSRFIHKILPFFSVVSLCLLASFVTLKNLGWEKTFAGEDYGVWYDFPERALYLVFYTWDTVFAPGKLNVTSMFSTIWSSTMYILDAFGFTPTFISRLMYWLFFAVPGVSMYILFFRLIRLHLAHVSRGGVLLGAVTAALFYMFNHFTMEIASIPISPYHLSYMLLPLVFVLFITNIHVVTRGSTVLMFVAVFVLLVGGNPSNTFTIVLLMLTYFIFFYRKIRIQITKPWLFLVSSLILILLATAYIYLPMLSIKANPYGNIDIARELFASVRFNSKFTSLANLFLLGGSVTWPNYTYFDTYTKGFTFLALGYGIIALALVSLILPFGKKLKIFLGLVLIVSLFFGKGTHPPFENIFMSIFSALPMLVGMYRNVYNKFIFFSVFSISILLGIFVVQAWDYFPQRLKKVGRISLFFIPFLICVYTWPFFVGIMMQYHGGDMLTVIPDEYRTASQWLTDDQTDTKVLSLPPAPRGAGLILQWDGNNRYVGFHPDKIFLNRPTLDSYWYLEKGLYGLGESNSWTGSAFEDVFEDVLQYANIHNIRYLMLHKDFVESYNFGGTGLSIIDGKLKSETLQQVIGDIPDVELIANTKFYTIYKLPDRLVYPHIYIPLYNAYLDGDFRHIADLFKLSSTKHPWALYATDTRKDRRFDEVARPLADDIYVQAKPRRPVVKEELNIDKIFLEMEQPVVRWKPGSTLYSYAILKEWYDLWQSWTIPAETIEKRLYYAQKRLNEVISFPDMSTDVFNNVSDMYARSYQEARISLDKMKEENEPGFSVLVNKYLLRIWDQRNTLLQSTVATDRKKILTTILSRQEREGEALLPVYDFVKAGYDIEIPVTGRYEVYVKNEQGQMYLVETKDFVKGKHAYGLSFESVATAVEQKNPDDPHTSGAIFQLTFEYHSSKPLNFTILDRKSDVIMAELFMPGTADEWKKYKLFLYSPYLIYNPEISSNLSQVRNVSFRRVFETTVLLKYIPEVPRVNVKPPNMVLQKINPTKYIVNITDAIAPYWLVFSESFNSNWKVYIVEEQGKNEDSNPQVQTFQTYFDGAAGEKYHKNVFFDPKSSFETVGKMPVSESRHFLANGYANGWYIAPTDAKTPTYKLIIEFYPQRYFYAGIGLALIFGLIFIGMVVRALWYL